MTNISTYLKIIPQITALFALLIITSCLNLSGYKYEKGTLPETPVNLTDFNTEFDDYNSTAPSLGELIPFCFSTNRNSNGKQFDVIYQPMNVNFDKSSGILKVTNEYANWSSRRDDYQIIPSSLYKIKTTGNEFGPNLIIEQNLNTLNFTLLYSTDNSGNSQINYISSTAGESFSEPTEVQFLNSESEDMYPTFTTDQSKIYFCSDRNEDRFDFFYVDVSSEVDIESILSSDASFEIVRDTSLSSEYDDKCPFIFKDKMVFTSNRPGGFGGYDLYYSIYSNGAWSEPINFGSDINSELDEYRPILIDEGVSELQTMMVFSSNRTGGLGGYDLYFVGIDN